MYNFLVSMASYTSFFLFAKAISDFIEMQRLKSEERREKYRQLAYSRVQRERIKQRNRNNLWQEVSKHE